jgi:hypothetical protein
MKNGSDEVENGRGRHESAAGDAGSAPTLLVLLISIPIIAALSHVLARSALHPHYGVVVVLAAGIILLRVAAAIGHNSSSRRFVYEFVQGGILLSAFVGMLRVIVELTPVSLKGVMVVTGSTLLLFVSLLVFYRRYRP